MKETLFADPDVFLCHQCGDCTEICPRGAKPAEVLSAIRSYIYVLWLACMAFTIGNSSRESTVTDRYPFCHNLCPLVSVGGMQIPSAEGFARYGYTQFFGHWGFKWYSKNVFFIVLIMVPAAALAIFSVSRGIIKMWRAMCQGNNIQSEFRPSVVTFCKEFLWPSLIEIVKHKRFRECGFNKDRARGHLPLILGFIGAFILTCWSAIRQDILGLIWPSFHGPLPLSDPFKILANIAAVSLLYGIWILWDNRHKLEEKGKASRVFYDWFLFGK